jgi:hypothetical protein
MDTTQSGWDEEAAESPGGPEFAGEVVLTETQLTAWRGQVR